MILSISYSTLTFVMKLATAFASMGLGLILDAYGFNAEAVTETVPPPRSVASAAQ